MHPGRDASRTPLFQVMFVLQNAPLPLPASADLKLAILDAFSGTAKFDLTLFASEVEYGLRATIEYRTDLFDEATSDRMLGHFRTLLEGIVADPDRPIGAIPMLTDAERRRLLGQWDEVGAPNLDDLSDEELDSLMNDLSSEGETTVE
jgi:non-ribosomal peptide synthetase component F